MPNLLSNISNNIQVQRIMRVRIFAVLRGRLVSLRLREDLYASRGLSMKTRYSVPDHKLNCCSCCP